MASKISLVQTAAIVAGAACVIATVGGTAFGTGQEHHTRASSGVSKAEVTSIVKAYVNSHKSEIVQTYIDAHKSEIQGPKPTHILFVTDSDHTSLQTVTHVGPFLMQAQCLSTGVSVQFSGPSSTAEFGTNTLGATNGGAGSTFETTGESRGFGVGTNTQGSQTVELVSSTTSYTVTYFEQADTSSPVNCDVVGYATQLK